MMTPVIEMTKTVMTVITVLMMGYLEKNVSVDTACGWGNAAIEVIMR